MTSFDTGLRAAALGTTLALASFGFSRESLATEQAAPDPHSQPSIVPTALDQGSAALPIERSATFSAELSEVKAPTYAGPVHWSLQLNLEHALLVGGVATVTGALVGVVLTENEPFAARVRGVGIGALVGALALGGGTYVNSAARVLEFDTRIAEQSDAGGEFYVTRQTAAPKQMLSRRYEDGPYFRQELLIPEASLRLAAAPKYSPFQVGEHVHVRFYLDGDNHIISWTADRCAPAAECPPLARETTVQP